LDDLEIKGDEKRGKMGEKQIIIRWNLLFLKEKFVKSSQNDYLCAIILYHNISQFENDHTKNLIVPPCCARCMAGSLCARALRRV
jgi:hypothetical protein